MNTPNGLMSAAGGRVELRRLERRGGRPAVCAVAASGAHPLSVDTAADLLALPVARTRELVGEALSRPPDPALAGGRNPSAASPEVAH